MKHSLLIPLIVLLAMTVRPFPERSENKALGENPIIRDRFTADPAALVYKNRVYLYTGHDEAPPDGKRFLMRDWRCYSSADLVHWQDHGFPMSVKTFAWAKSDAWASQVIERKGKFYWYAAVSHGTIHGFSIAVGVADSPTGPFHDARGSALITNDMTTDVKISWDDIDPTVFIDDDGQAYLFWGNTKCRYAKLKPNMTELDGAIVNVELPKFTEAPWIHKYKGRYYLSYAYGFPEQIAYATADRITGPYTFRGVINDLIPNSPTNHQAIIKFKGRWYFFYHNAGLPGGGEYHRSVCVEELFYNPDGTIRQITQAKRSLNIKAAPGRSK
jgi:beta-xylosidase